MASGEYDYGPYPTYQAVNIANHNLYSNYNALQLSWVRRKGKYDITMNYTYGKAMGIVGADQLNLSQDYGPMPYDRRQIFNAAYSIELPSPVRDSPVLAGFVNGWQLSGITQLQSGVNISASSSVRISMLPATSAPLCMWQMLTIPLYPLIPSMERTKCRSHQSLLATPRPISRRTNISTATVSRFRPRLE